MIRIRTPSRLHFGLFSLPSEQEWTWLNFDRDPTLPRRNFGGVGLMIDRPGIELTVEKSDAWSADGPLARRALEFAQTYCRAVNVRETFRIQVQSAAPEHVGLGTGTQLGLAVARAIARSTDQKDRDVETLARHTNRGLRSGLGVHGFQLGGFLVEGGKTAFGKISPMLVRQDFPDHRSSETWLILLITLKDLPGIHGAREIDAFAALAKQASHDETTGSLCRLVLLGMLPALAEGDMVTFGEALYDFNRRVGEMFRLAQAGPFAHARIEEIVKTIREFGVKGVGQSSWGPTVFALAKAEEIGLLQNWLMLNLGIAKEEMLVAKACNHGAVLSSE